MLAQVIVAASALAVSVSAQGVTSKIAPSAPMPSGCMASVSGPMNLATVNVTTASKVKRDSNSTYPYAPAPPVVITLTNGVLMDNKNRTGYIASNHQLQFDSPPQAGAIYTAGFSVCGNGTLALGGSAIWYDCLSGTFYNLYDDSQGQQCSEVFLETLPASSSSTTSAASQLSDGQVQATPVSQISDGQVQATTAASSLTSSKTSSSIAKVTEITDGQIQASSAASSLTSSMMTTTTAAPALVSQITDGQIQATSALTVAPYKGAAVAPTAAAQLLLGAAAVAAYVL